MIERGDVYWIDLDGPDGSSVQANRRPAVIVQSNPGNKFTEVTIVVVATRTIKDKKYPCDVIITDSSSCLDVPSRIMCNQIFTVPKSHLGSKIGKLDDTIMTEVDEALKNALGLN